MFRLTTSGQQHHWHRLEHEQRSIELLSTIPIKQTGITKQKVSYAQRE
ncbi:hypothetical protein QWZ16_14965 [Vibrio ostreicida]|uniref:Uncharacterized protein n=1 Tax=Vibrio ostreicida TaxID=526588 RepID=A0ABT8BY34_9VIBR|nr:hypothetical protein [Vibrio ostreicida]MDN3610988.1 hypothetical protein [Vibrio ostreicida]